MNIMISLDVYVFALIIIVLMLISLYYELIYDNNRLKIVTHLVFLYMLFMCFVLWDCSVSKDNKLMFSSKYKKFCTKIQELPDNASIYLGSSTSENFDLTPNMPI